jgi:glycosyltransferase involved in cell wall biosynthesis
MKVVFATYDAVSILHGGVLMQTQRTYEGVQKLGVTASLFDQWSGFSKESCDLFHIMSATIGTYHLAREIRALGIPMVVSPVTYSLHTTGFVRTALRVSHGLRKIARGVWSDYDIIADMCSWAAGVLPNTRAEGDYLQEGLGVNPKKIHIIPNGVDDRFLNLDPTLFREKYDRENFILTVGHTGHERKNVLMLIKALARIDHPAVIIGRIIDSPYGRACVEEASRYKHILLVDGLPNDSPMLASAYAACDTFVLPSLFETPGIAALEAGLAGAKIVITKHGGTREYFGEMAEYVDPYSVESIRKGITEALSRRKDEKLRNHIRENYLWSHTAEKTVDAYRTILARSG